MSAIDLTSPINQENFPVCQSVFGNTSDKAWSEIQKTFFPKSKKVSDLALVRLIYLASLVNTQKVPFTEKQLKIFKASDWWDNATNWSLRACYVINTVLFAVVPFLGLVPSKAAGDYANTNGTEPNTPQPALSPSVLGTIGALAGVVTNALAVWATGTSPHEASRTFNAKQDTLLGIERAYADLADRLIVLYFSDAEAEAVSIASKIDVDNLKERISVVIQSKERGKQIVAYLKGAVEYISSDKKILPPEVRLRRFIEEERRRYWDKEAAF